MNIDIIKTVNDIRDRQAIIDCYRMTHYIDRIRAIELIRNKRLEDDKIAAATMAVQAQSSLVSFNEASDESLISELKMQIDIMKAELAEEEKGKSVR